MKFPQYNKICKKAYNSREIFLTENEEELLWKNELLCVETTA